MRADVSQACGTDTNISGPACPGPYPLGLNRTQAQTGLKLITILTLLGYI